MTGSLQELRALLDGMEIGFLTTVGADGHFHSRFMQLQPKKELDLVRH